MKRRPTRPSADETISLQARALAQVLLKHHRDVCRNLPADELDRALRTITYGELCQRSEEPVKPRFSGVPLGRVERWSASNSWPLLSTLVVRKDTGKPGKGYGHASGNLSDWRSEVEVCIRFRGYPREPPSLGWWRRLGI